MQFVKDLLIKMSKEAIAGTETASIVITLTQVIAGGGFLVMPFLFIGIPGVLFFGHLSRLRKPGIFFLTRCASNRVDL